MKATAAILVDDNHIDENKNKKFHVQNRFALPNDSLKANDMIEIRILNIYEMTFIEGRNNMYKLVNMTSEEPT